MTPSEFKQARQALGITQQELADELNVNERTIRRWEHADGYMAFGKRVYGPSDKGIEMINGLNPNDNTGD